MKQTITLNENGICIDGKYRTLLASSLFYFRIPAEKWDVRMKLLRAAGYNTIDVYFPWNYHETAPGMWDFTGSRDVTRFLQLAADNHLYVIARPGPYICSEWDGGAIPAWLSAGKIPVRQDDPAFLSVIGSWYAHILPLLAPFQITCGGPVICMQIENELDFFSCKSPVSYMQKLMKHAQSLGMDVPLFYCCGQNDLLRAGGLTPGLYTAFNVYAGSAQPGLEERALHLYHSAAERRMPFLITETNREHSFLKRLFSCGARLLSPYNQTAGCTMDWYNGITNWGSAENPIALMASDYDFDSMIGSAGEVNEQFYEARLFAGLLHFLGESLAKAVPAAAQDVTLSSPEPVGGILTCLETDRGALLAVSNLGEACTQELSALLPDGPAQLPLIMPPLYTKLLPFHLQLTSDSSVILHLCNYELAWVTEENEKLTVGMYGYGPFHALVSLDGITHTLIHTPQEETDSCQIGRLTFLLGTLKSMGEACVPGLPDPARPLCAQRTQKTLTSCLTAICDFPSPDDQTDERQSCKKHTILPLSEPVRTPVLPMEHLGQYRGIGCYQFRLEQDTQLLLWGASDILTIRSSGAAETFYADGSAQTRCLAAGNCAVYTEIWGHSNFDDIRRPSLHMGSLKGLQKIMRIDHRTDLSDNWLFDLDEQPVGEWYFFRHSPYNTIMGIDSYNRAVSPLRTVYDRWVELPRDADCLALQVSCADCLIYVYVNGHLEGSIQKSNPFLDLSAYAGNDRIELCLRTERRYYTDQVGRVTLLTGRQLAECAYSRVETEAITMPGTVTQSSFPLRPAPDRLMLFSFAPGELPDSDCKLIFEGQDVKLTILLNGRAVARLLLPTDSFPVVAGGRRDTVFLCREWLEQEMPLILCQPTGPHPAVTGIRADSFVSVI